MLATIAALSALLFLSPLTLATPQPEIWRHGWKNVGEMLYMHGGNSSVISDEAIVFTAKHYPIVGFSNCYGHGDKVYQEDAAITTARKLRETNPNVKNVFYWKVDIESQVKLCSSGQSVWKQHPEWRLANVTSNDRGYYDLTNPAVRTFWKNHLLSLAYEMDEKNKKPLFDAIYLDGFSDGDAIQIKIDHATQHEWGIGNRQMVMEAQTEVNYLGFNQLLVINGLDTLANVPIHAAASPASMVDHFAVLQFLNRKTGDWLQEPMKELLFETIRSPINQNRTLLIKAWPGPIVKQKDIWPNHSEPKTPEEMRKAAQDYLNAALALFLLVAEDTMWFSYSWFWAAGDYIPFGKDHTCPDEFYPTFKCPLGEPLGPPKRAHNATKKDDYVYIREYEHASVYVDLNNRDATGVTWKKGDPKWCPGAPKKTNKAKVNRKRRNDRKKNHKVTPRLDISAALNHGHDENVHSMYETAAEAFQRYRVKSLESVKLPNGVSPVVHSHGLKHLNIRKVVKKLNKLEQEQDDNDNITTTDDLNNKFQEISNIVAE
jgi:hypothetical protein